MAREVFAVHGPDAPLEDVARRAGVGSATLYRHFPSRHELLVAVYTDDVDQLAHAGRDLLRTEPPGRALTPWLRLLLTHITARRGLAAAALNTTPEQGRSLVDTWHGTLGATLADLLTDAERHGTARAGIRPHDLLMLTNAIAHATEKAENREVEAERLLQLVLAGVNVAPLN